MKKGLPKKVAVQADEDETSRFLCIRLLRKGGSLFQAGLYAAGKQAGG